MGLGGLYFRPEVNHKLILEQVQPQILKSKHTQFSILGFIGAFVPQGPVYAFFRFMTGKLSYQRRIWNINLD